jgi:hypothetical protein
LNESDKDGAIVFRDVLDIGVYGVDESPEHLTRIHKALLHVMPNAIGPSLPLGEL